MLRIWQFLMVGIAMVFLNACGGGGNSSISSDGISVLKEGSFSKVKGLSYETSSGESGITDEEGTFTYNDGDKITFVLNEVTIGTISAKESITVFDFKNPMIVSQFLDSLDSDKDPSNGIDLSYITKQVTISQMAKLHKRTSPLETSAVMQEDPVAFKLEKVTAYDARYVDFLKRNNANIFPSLKSTTEKFMQEIESKITIPQTDVYANSAKGIVIGKTIPMRAYLEERSSIKSKVEILYSKEKYDYRINLATLNRLYNQGLYEIAEKNNKVLENAEDRNAIVDDAITKVGTVIDVANQVVEAVSKGELDYLAPAKTGVDYIIDTTQLPDGYKPGLKFASTVAYDCLKEKNIKACSLNSAANVIGVYAETVLSEEYPVLATVLADGAGTGAGLTDMWISCYFKPDAKSCVQTLLKEGTINSLKLVSKVAEIGLLTKARNAVSNAKVALEAFSVKYLTQSDACDAIQYYDFHYKEQVIENCKKDKNKIDKLFKAIVRAEVLDDVSPFNVNYDEIGELYLKLEEKYSDDIVGIYKQAFKQYMKSDGTVDKVKTEVALKSYVNFEIDTVTPSIEANNDGSYSLDITACMRLDSDIVLENETFELKLIDEFQSTQYFDLDPYRTASRGIQKVCGVLHNVELNGSNSFITGTKVQPFLIDAKLNYTIQDSLDGFTHELTDRVLNEGRLIQGDKSSVEIVDTYTGEQTYHLYATYPNDIRSNASGRYRYNWTIETLGCQTKTYDEVALDYAVCNKNISLAKVDVYDAESGEFVVSQTKTLEPELSSVSQDDSQFTIEGETKIYTQNAQTSTYNFTVVGREGYALAFEEEEGLEVSSSTQNSVTVMAQNTGSDIIQKKLTITATKADESISKEVIYVISPTSDPIANRETISYRNSLETFPIAKGGETILKKWGLLNITDHTIHSVFLQWNPQKSYSGLKHQERVELGDIRPFDLNLQQSLEIGIPDGLQGTHHFGYFDVFYTKEDGSIEKLLYSDGRNASVIYSIDVQEEESTSVSPEIQEVSIYAVDQTIYGAFTVIQPDAQKIKNLRVYFSTDTYFRENTQYVDVGAGYETLQNSGAKSFVFDASYYASEKLYWKIECSNEDGLSLQYIPSGTVSIVDIKSIEEVTPQNFHATQTDEGVLLSWDTVDGATQYRPMASMSYTLTGDYMDITSGCDFKSETSCLISASRFDEHKIWYFGVGTDVGPMSEPVCFEWQDPQNPQPNSDYEAYLQGKTLYELGDDSIIFEWYFNDTLSELHVYTEENSDVKTTLLTLRSNGLEILDGTSDTDYWIIKSIENDYLILEQAEITEGGVYLSRNSEIKLYFDKPQLTGDDINAESVLIGNTYYQYCGDDNTSLSMTFGSDGNFSYQTDADSGSSVYSFDGKQVTIYFDSASETHTLVDVGDIYVTFDEKGSDDTFYVTEGDSRNHPATDCSGGDDERYEIFIDNLVGGRVNFIDIDTIPSDAWIRITPTQYQEDGNWNGLNCKLDSDGVFGTECYIDYDETGIREAFGDSATTYQIVVYKNNIEPDEHHWNCSEDVYKYVGDDLASSAWSSIEVENEDYKDRSDESCTDNGSSNDTENNVSLNISASDGLYEDMILIGWNSIDNVTKYNIYRCTNTDIGSCSVEYVVDSATAAVDDYVFNDHNVLAKSIYYYRVEAVIDDKSAIVSNVDQGYLSDTATLPVSSWISASDGTYTDKIVIEWEDKGLTDGAAYELYRCANTDTSTCKLLTRRTNTVFEDIKEDGLITNKTYYYRIKIQGTGTDSGEFSESDEGSISPIVSAPESPIASQGIFGDKVLISWIHVNGATHYKIYACTTYGYLDVENDEKCYSLGTQTATDGDGNIYTQTYDTQSTAGKKRWYYVSAKKDDVWSEYSRWSNSGYSGLDEPLVPNTSVVILEDDNSPVVSVLATLPGDHGASSYEYYRCSDSVTTESCELIQTALPYISVLDNKINRKIQYYYRTRSVSYSGNISEFSEPFELYIK